MTSNRRLTAAEAHAWGLVSEVVEADSFAARVAERAAELAAGPTRAVALTKRLYDEAATSTLEEQLEREAEAQAEAAQTERLPRGRRGVRREARGRASAGAEEAQDLAVVRASAPRSASRRSSSPSAKTSYWDFCALARRARRYPLLLQLGRETRGPSVVPASDGAIEDLDGHAGSVPGVGSRLRRRAPILRVRANPCTAPSPPPAGAILASWTRTILRKLTAAGSALAFTAGQVLIERDKPGSGLYVVVDGHLLVEAPEGARELGPGVGGGRAGAPLGGRTAYGARPRAHRRRGGRRRARGDRPAVRRGSGALAERLARSS